jgi:DNA repair protein MmcB-like
MPGLPKPFTPQDGRQSGTALFVARGTRRLLRRLNFSTVTELPLLSGRRADIVALAMDATIFIVEIKSSVADFRADAKWRDPLRQVLFRDPRKRAHRNHARGRGAYPGRRLWRRNFATSTGTSRGRRHPPRGARALCPCRGAPVASFERPRSARGERLGEEPLSVIINDAVNPRRANLFRTLRRQHTCLQK